LPGSEKWLIVYTRVSILHTDPVDLLIVELEVYIRRRYILHGKYTLHHFHNGAASHLIQIIQDYGGELADHIRREAQLIE
jgi:hypothetical protein